MSYQVLARKYRPAAFKELEGQEHVLRALINALEQNRLHHAYLFAGTRGVGKTTIARILAKCLNCEKGVTSEPCGECSTCMEISEGRSVDLIEVDAASRTGIDDMRDLLDNTQYMPTSSRFKVYLIDEVHMLSKPAFNAMLKTLEEPPEHVKFLFATTDPKKLPITVLSRCLQFNLKNLSPERIVNYLKQILPRESVEFEESALWQLGRAADGSMRDALSLTDQAISYGKNSLTEDAVSTMLGSIDQKEVYALLDALIHKDGVRLLEKVRHLAQFSPDYHGLLNEMLSVLHRVAIAQAVPEGLDNSQGDRQLVLAVATSISREDVQLFYQIGLIGKRDLPMAPDPRSGFEMVLLRMLAFTPDGENNRVESDSNKTRTEPTGGGSEPSGSNADGNPENPGHKLAGLLSTINGSSQGNSASGNKKPAYISRKSDEKIAEPPRPPQEYAPKNDERPERTEEPAGLHKVATPVEAAVDTAADEAAGAITALAEIKATPEVAPETKPESTIEERQDTWSEILPGLALTGVTQTLAANCTLESSDNNNFQLKLNEHHASLWNKTHESRIAQALTKRYGTAISVAIEVGVTEAETPAMIDRRRQAARQAQAVIAIENDENIQSLIQQFDGAINRDSIAPIAGEQP